MTNSAISPLDSAERDRKYLSKLDQGELSNTAALRAMHLRRLAIQFADPVRLTTIGSGSTTDNRRADIQRVADQLVRALDALADANGHHLLPSEVIDPKTDRWPFVG